MKQNIIFILVLSFVLTSQADALSYSPILGNKTFLLSNPTDPYYSLAKEIAEKEGINIINEIQQLKDYKITYLLWVISPELLTEKVILEYANSVYTNNIIIMGIISGRNIEQAKRLWQDGNSYINTNRIVLNAEMTNNSLPANVLIYNNDKIEKLLLTKENIFKNIMDAGYVQVSMHGATRSWFCEKTKISIKSDELPSLKRTIIESQGCNNFRPWDRGSIVLESIEKGAIGYSGFVYSPISGSQLGAYNGLIFTNTWEDFSIGHVVQIQNRAALRSYARLPHYFLMGDPRIYLSVNKPYELLEDTLKNKDERVILLKNCKKGFLPVKVTDGAKYSSVKVSNGKTHYDNSNYFDRDIEMINIGTDKYIIVKNEQSDLIINLSLRPALFEKIHQNLLNRIDTTIYRRHQEGLYLVIGIIFFIIYLIQFIRKKLPIRVFGYSLLTALLIIILLVIVDSLRFGNITITSKSIQFNTLNFLGLFFLFLTGSAIYYKSQSIRQKIWAIILMIFPRLSFIIIYSVLSIVRILLPGNAFNIQKTNYLIKVVDFFEISISIALLYLILSNVQKWLKIKS